MRSRELEQISRTLRGPVVERLQRKVPELARMPRDRTYDVIMDNPAIADGCFKVFRKERALFSDLLVGRDGQPVTHDSQVLSCGRSMAEVTTLIVRAIAKRYFRAHVGKGVNGKGSIGRGGSLRANGRRQQRRQPFVHKAWVLLGLRDPPRPPRKPASTPAEDLYKAIQDFLIYEWQVPLIPHYAPLSPAVVARVGPMLLTLRRVEEVKALAAQPEDKPAILMQRLTRSPGLPTLKPVPAVEQPSGFDVAGLAAGYRSGRARSSRR